MIKEIADIEELTECAKVIRESFITVAHDLNLNQENAPTNPAFIKAESLLEAKNKGIRFFGLFERDRQIGCIAIERANPTLYYVERLGVLPQYRHKGLGRQLMDFAFDYVKQLDAERISIGVINENEILKTWYLDYGFKETGIKTFAHLPFTVCFLEKKV